MAHTEEGGAGKTGRRDEDLADVVVAGIGAEACWVVGDRLEGVGGLVGTPALRLLPSSLATGTVTEAVVDDC